ncbi:DUF1800 domain-containing protein [Novosphingobium lindaniclasticum]
MQEPRRDTEVLLDESTHHSIAAQVSALAGAMALQACGGDDSGPSPAATPTPEVPALPIGLPQQRASRFLNQATNGATRTEIDAVVNGGIDVWLDDQFLIARGQSHWEWLVSQGYNGSQYKSNTSAWDYSIWRQIISYPDQLRQKVSLSLMDIFVVSLVDIPGNWKPFSIASYMDTLLENAFGNFRSLLSAITISPAMGEFLTYIGSKKQSSSGKIPDENYARELMQLFTIGLYELNLDGSYRLDSDGNPVETYTQDDVSQLARVFTGFSYASSDRSSPEYRRMPLIISPGSNETGSATFLGFRVNGGGMAAVEAALDVIFQHSNVGPFFAKGLIQRLVTSNPTPGFISRVATVFNNNGNGVRGDMKAVVRAILKDNEARSDSLVTNDLAGMLKPPVQRLANWARAFRVNSVSGAWKVASTADARTAIGQSPGRSPSVFNFFQPDYSPSHTELEAHGLVSPEFQIADDLSIIGYVNFMSKAVNTGLVKNDVVADYSDLTPLAPDAKALVAEVNLRLAAGQLPLSTCLTIEQAVSTISINKTSGPLDRAKVAVLLVISSSDYLTQR